MGVDFGDHHCAKRYMCHMVERNPQRGVMEKSINHQWKPNGIIKDAHPKNYDIMICVVTF
jgi:hypothetical protein